MIEYIPQNPFAAILTHDDRPIWSLNVEAIATMALAYEQHQRNRLAAITAKNRGIALPDDLEQLVYEGR